jgi:HKD family nuclease
VKTELLTQIAPENALLLRLRAMARQASAAVVGVAFVWRRGLKPLFSSLGGLLEARGRIEVFTSGYLGVTEPEALDDLLKLSHEYHSLTVRFNVGDRFHAKFIYLRRPAQAYCLLVGSQISAWRG